MSQALQVYELLLSRAPAAHWDIRQVVQAVGDFEDVDVLEVAGACAAYLQETPGARNGNRTFRTFLARARKDSELQSRKGREAQRLAPYDRRKNR